MSDDIPFDKRFELAPETVEEVAPGVRRLLANNPGPFTFKGTVSYIVGRGQVAIIDPGPLDETHIAALLDAVRGRNRHPHLRHPHPPRSFPRGATHQGGDRGPGARRRAAPRRASAPCRRGAASRCQQRHRVQARPRAGRRRGRHRPAAGPSRRSRRRATPRTTWLLRSRRPISCSRAITSWRGRRRWSRRRTER